MMKNWRILLIIGLTAWFLLAGCKAQEEEKTYGGPDTGPAYGDLFIDASIGDASTLLPPLAVDAASANINSLIYNGLVKYDGNLNLVGDLAESWDISPDGLTITFHLRKGVKWQDGAPFTAQDVLFTYQVMVDPKTPTAYSGDYLQVKKAEAPDDYTFRVTYPQPFAPALGSWGLAILPRHLLAGVDLTKSPLGRHPVGTGPYIFKEWRAGEKIALAYNPNYFEGRPYLNGYVYLVKPDTATMFMELKAGNLDRMGLNAIQYSRQTEYPKFQRMYKKYRYMPFSYIYLGYNLNDSRFADRRVRQALTHAINKKEIIDGVLMGLGEEAYGPYKPGTWYYNPNVPKFPYDPAKAKALLAAAGWTPNADGVLTKDGAPFAFTILTNQGNDTRQRTAEIIQSRLRAMGILVKIRRWSGPPSSKNSSKRGGSRRSCWAGTPAWTRTSSTSGVPPRPSPANSTSSATKTPRWTRFWRRGAIPSTGKSGGRPTSASRRSWPRTSPTPSSSSPTPCPPSPGASGASSRPPPASTTTSSSGTSPRASRSTP